MYRFLFLLTLFFSCKKDNSSNTGQLFLSINGQIKEFQLVLEPRLTDCAPDTCITLSSNIRDENGSLRENLAIIWIPFRIGKHLLLPTSPAESLGKLKMSYITATDDGHVFTGGYYNFIETDSNYVDVHTWSDQDGNAVGEFKANLALSPYWLDLGYQPDTISVSGTFKCPVNW